MPSRHIVRSFAENNFYHVYNRGFEKRKIFMDDEDYNIFNYYLFIYLSPLKLVLEKFPQFPIRLQSKNLNEKIELIAYCFMPNHFHFLLKQSSKDAVSKFMKQLINAYTRYYNTKYRRVGNLMQGRFKAALIESDNLLLHVNRYIHLNPLLANLTTDLVDYPWSSYRQYIGLTKDNLCTTQIILDHFPSSQSYKDFIQDQVEYAKQLNKIKHLTIDT